MEVTALTSMATVINMDKFNENHFHNLKAIANIKFISTYKML